MSKILDRVVTVSRVFEHKAHERSWKEPDGTAHTITEKRGWYVAIAELGIAIELGTTVKPEIKPGQQLVLSLTVM